ncbi:MULTISPECIES: DNA polymerase III subunit epsilon [Herbaspirillum]|jgi:DNA polymerase-3 subunit epsilon|uniref:DNA polymerase III subunit epsilon n=5 Tax=Pseudomonadati TaxID=3379134 RepID=A0AAJ2HEH5_9BURK|nr:MULTISPECIES: DNA polymerase III subunit epsilon [Herbaspirillum]MBW9335541.1 DNA polymerase III subunit epsilon [Herbaspirillum sp. RU 5E]MAF04782.1 DNA polymerase III subunit epsilon [Herbaspirillum sp.]MBN9357628.1 DNA polymerase III subunit epsilon [Herbaspirillum huttiense]MBO15021.1 DNA polymerase III subunit epsilon [Herbaspirillum sp.]MBP1316540.1 DNA polymerase-3 subunit epsilon [Herbaspirillum sp. 1130]|tara:strand:- start:11674 stop:12408 length:735 start_codon:yes stop_codon:yes gene_type:complete
MRQIILDTETTGLSPRNGNRILEIGCVEVLNRQLSGKNLHFYINPERDSEEGALAVHGLTTEFLADKPTFKQIAAEFLDYVRGAQIIIHNAPFDVGFLDAELALLGLPPFKEHVSDVVDSLQMAKELHPGRRNSLDALCDRYGISNAHRVLHGALLDAELLAEVYLSMTRGQNSLTMDLGAEEEVSEGEGKLELAPLAEVIVVAASEEELGLHEDVLNQLDKEARGSCVWRFEPPPPEAAAEAA